MYNKAQVLQKVNLFLILCIGFFQSPYAQNKIYRDSIIAYEQEYINNHEVVGKDDRRFIHFYDIDESYRVPASFEKIEDTGGFEMNTSSGMKKHYFVYGLLTFKIHDTLLHLYIYQSEALMKQKKYKDYLFIPFGDATSGFESYGGGRYLDFQISDIKSNNLVLDFNKAYNPYCAYVSGRYSCPIPPKENNLGVAIPAGEKTFTLSH